MRANRRRKITEMPAIHTPVSSTVLFNSVFTASFDDDNSFIDICTRFTNEIVPSLE